MTELCTGRIKIKPKIPLGATERKVFAYRFFHTDLNLIETAKALGLNYTAVRQAWYRLKHRPDLFKLCPICFKDKFDGKVCHNCGFEADQMESIGFNHNGSPVTDFAYNGLGTIPKISDLKRQPDGLHFANRPQYLQHILDNGLSGHAQERKLERLRSELTEALKDYSVTDEARVMAGRILVQEFNRFATGYPNLLHARSFDQQIIHFVIQHLKPWLNKNNDITQVNKVA